MADETSSERCYEQTEGEINDAGRAQRNDICWKSDETSSETCYEQIYFGKLREHSEINFWWKLYIFALPHL